MQQFRTAAGLALRIRKLDLVNELRSGPARRLKGIGGIMARYRPLVCPIETVLAKIPPGSRLFDIGCGSGSLMFLALRLQRAVIARGYDISQTAVARARVFADSVPGFMAFHLTPAETPPSLDGCDAITMVDVLHHIPPPLQQIFIDKVLAAMEPSAKLIIADINPRRRIRAFCNQLHDLVVNRDWVNLIDPDSVCGVARRAGAIVTSQEFINTLWYSHYLIVIDKKGRADPDQLRPTTVKN